MNQIKNFKHEIFGNVRVLLIQNEPTFNLYDVSFSLGYTKTSKDTLYLRKDLIENICLSLGIKGLSPTDNREIEVTKYIDFQNTYIKEDDLYELMLESKAKHAKVFRKWITHDVIPSIRKHGMYITENVLDEILGNPDIAIGLLQNYKAEKQKRIEAERVNQEFQIQLDIQAPKVALYDTAMSAKNNQTMGAVAKSLGVGRNKLFQHLREKKVLMNNNLPYQRYIDQGYFDVRQYTITHLSQGLENKTQTLVTPKGMAYIHKLLTKESSRGEAYETS